MGWEWEGLKLPIPETGLNLEMGVDSRRPSPLKFGAGNAEAGTEPSLLFW